MHGTRTALRDPATELRSSELELLTHYPKQRRIGLGLYADRFAVDRKRDVRHALLHWQSVLARGISRTLLAAIRPPQAARINADCP
jgi:hypothetical protein